MLTGCHTIKDAHWATKDDTVARWEHAMPSLPVEVRGQTDRLSNEALISAVRRTLNAAVGEGDDGLSEKARFVLEAGGAPQPADDRYCAKAHPVQPLPPAGEVQLMTLTLCDGTRLVGWSQRRMDADAHSPDRLKRLVGQLEDLLLIGIEQSPTQYVNIQG